LRNGIDEIKNHVEKRRLLECVSFQDFCALENKKKKKKHKAKSQEFAYHKNKEAKAALCGNPHTIFCKKEKNLKIMFHNALCLSSVYHSLGAWDSNKAVQCHLKNNKLRNLFFCVIRFLPTDFN